MDLCLLLSSRSIKWLIWLCFSFIFSFPLGKWHHVNSLSLYTDGHPCRHSTACVSSFYPIILLNVCSWHTVTAQWMSSFVYILSLSLSHFFPFRLCHQARHFTLMCFRWKCAQNLPLNHCNLHFESPGDRNWFYLDCHRLDPRPASRTHSRLLSLCPFIPFRGSLPPFSLSLGRRGENLIESYIIQFNHIETNRLYQSNFNCSENTNYKLSTQQIRPFWTTAAASAIFLLRVLGESNWKLHWTQGRHCLASCFGQIKAHYSIYQEKFNPMDHMRCSR